MPPPACESNLHTRWGGTCRRSGKAEYDGRCWQHRPATAAERQAAKEQRLARYAADEAADRARVAAKLLPDPPVTREQLADKLLEVGSAYAKLKESTRQWEHDRPRLLAVAKAARAFLEEYDCNTFRAQTRLDLLNALREWSDD